MITGFVSNRAEDGSSKVFKEFEIKTRQPKSRIQVEWFFWDVNVRKRTKKKQS